ncbi:MULTISPECIES: extracellular solute-binding protein [unclassified Haladaptatus]|uniref:extracellular solute-binding protein n=1 Tax=unclassified Haladaptatus TaxID=2622732 RepID=UPI00209C5533|nr:MULTISPECIES: extracellular solute-binding protein [unclassified Haladaptatus]MCO8243392.1 extracellular solute-binding protein [Haladaptatus sp. AB643]MCO8254799.1 extracellular solute-binding protein [Haladaptatus sp. AB618]
MPSTEGANSALTRRQLLGGVGLAGTVGLSGCNSRSVILGNSADTSGTTIQFWTLFSGGDGATMKSIVDRFNDEQPIGNVRIDRQRIPWDDYYTKLYTALVADKGPDIAIMHQALMGRFQRMLVPYNPYLSDSTADKYVPTLWERMRFDGDQLSLPLDAHPIGIYYNRSLFEKAGLDPDSPPTNFEEFEHACDTITKKTDAHAFAPTPYLDPIGMLRTFIAFDEQRGGHLFTDDLSTVTFDDDAGMGTAQLFGDITGKYGWDIPNASENRADIAFQDNKMAMTMNGTWYAAVLESLDGFDWSMFKPFVAPEKKRNVTQSGSHTVILPRNPHRDERKTRVAVKAAEWITQKNPVWGTRAGHLPAAKDALHSKALRNSPLWPKSLSKFFQMANNDRLAYLPRTPFNVNNSSTWSFFPDIYAHNVSPKAGMQRGANSIQRLINDVD